MDGPPCQVWAIRLKPDRTDASAPWIWALGPKTQVSLNAKYLTPLDRWTALASKLSVSAPWVWAQRAQSLGDHGKLLGKVPRGRLSECGTCGLLVGWNLGISGWWQPFLGDGHYPLTSSFLPLGGSLNLNTSPAQNSRYLHFGNIRTKKGWGGRDHKV